MKKIIFIGIVITVFTSCSKELMEINTNSDIPVVESYFYVGDTVVNVNISQLIPYTTDGDALQEGIDSLDVNFTYNGISYLMTDQSNGNYEFSTNGFIVSENDKLDLNFIYNNQTATASTIAPAIPMGFQLSANTLQVERILEGTMGMPTFDPLEITWSNADNSYYFLIIEYLEIEQDFINGNSASKGIEVDNLKVISPFTESAYSLNSRDIQLFGTYRIVLFHINQEYADLFESINQNTQNLTNPLSNVENGWGIFTGVSSDTLLLEVQEI